MSRKISTGVLKLWYVPSISNTAAPTTTEINAGTNLTGFLKRNGLKTPQGGSTADASDVSSRYNATVAGSYGGQPITVDLFRDSASGSDTAWTTLARGTTGYLVVGRFGLTPASAERVEVWPIEVLSREMADIADNETQHFMVSCAVPSAPNDAAAVA